MASPIRGVLIALPLLWFANMLLSLLLHIKYTEFSPSQNTLTNDVAGFPLDWGRYLDRQLSDLKGIFLESNKHLKKISCQSIVTMAIHNNNWPKWEHLSLTNSTVTVFLKLLGLVGLLSRDGLSHKNDEMYYVSLINPLTLKEGFWL